MGKIKQIFKNLSLRKSIAVYITFFALAALGLSIATSGICRIAVDHIQDSYEVSKKQYYLTDEHGQQLGGGVGIIQERVDYSPRDEMLLKVFDKLPLFAVPIYSALSVLLAAMLFYRNKLKQPLALLTEASEKISDNDLDFTLQYTNDDEMGRLCLSFEMMRAALSRNYSEMWRQMEERKRLNAAFAHDLRTPLTVLKGYGEMLQCSGDAGTRETAAVMSGHIKRLERYAESMSQLVRIEDAAPQYRDLKTADLLEVLENTAEVVCSRHRLRLDFDKQIVKERLCVDEEMISQVFDNLLANACRYAKEVVKISAEISTEISPECTKDGLLLCVRDDGEGFSGESLKNALNPYYTEEKHSEHFGLGLYICKILAEHHNGWLHIKNENIGASVTVFFENHVL